MPVRTVRVLYYEGCPGHRPTVELVRHVADQLGVPVEVEEVEVRDAAQAEELRFLGSPTVQVNGLDVEPAARTRSEYAMACRTYAGGAGVPPVDLLRAALTSSSCCCAGPTPLGVTVSARVARNGAADAGSAGGLLASTGAVATAVATTACCWLPPLVIAAGASAVGVAGFVERWRPLLAAAAVALVSCSFYAGYFRRPRCGCSGPTWARRVGRITPWIASVIVATVLIFPEQVVGLIRGRSPTPALAHSTAVHRFTVEGMTCEACASTLEAELKNLPEVSDVEVDFSTRIAEVRGARESILAEVMRVAASHGWRAVPVKPTDHR